MADSCWIKIPFKPEFYIMAYFVCTLKSLLHKDVFNKLLIYMHPMTREEVPSVS